MGETLVLAQIQIRLEIIELWSSLKLTVGQSQQRESPEQRENQGAQGGWAYLCRVTPGELFKCKTF